MTIRTVVLLAALALAGRTVQAQHEAVIEAIAPVLMAEDARRFDLALFRRGLEHPDPLVRRKTALAVGRVGDLRGTGLILEHLRDPDSTVQADLMFALGLLRDTAAVGPILTRFSERPGLWREAAQEGITALAKIGDPRVGPFFAGVLRRTQVVTADTTAGVALQVARELWRLGRSGPINDLVPFLRDTLIEMRQAALYSVARVRPPLAGPLLVLALRDKIPLHRSWAARALNRSYADSAGLPADAVIADLKRLLADDDDGVRINALRALGSFADSSASAAITPLLADQDVNTRVTAAATLGLTGGAEAAAALTDILKSREPWAVRREALLALARVDSTAFLAVRPGWAGSGDWRDRAAAIEAMTVVHGGTRPSLAEERDPRVIAAALDAWNRGDADPGVLRLARSYLAHPDIAVRGTAASIVGRAADPADVAPLTAAYRLGDRDSSPDAALAILGALDSIASASPAAALRVEQLFLQVAARPESPVIRRWAETAWPEAADRWGPAVPIETGRTLEDYRQLARRYVVGTDQSRYPRVFIETEQRSVIELELFGPEAPLTVAHFLLLVDRHYFDGNSWHRVVPNFVVQDGDRRGDGWGSSPGVIRDEINRRRYGAQVVGMALSGPDTGSSQWFITHSPQPHLDGAYTVFGRVVGGGGAFKRISQGDRITTIRR